MESLKEAAILGDIDRLYTLLRVNCELLERIDENPYVDSPLHIAASAGHTHFALEILRLKPSFGRKLNPDGRSPLHLALSNGHINTVKRLIEYDPELIRVQGREGITPLHYLVDNEFGEEYIDLLAEFLIKCPASIRYRTIRGKTALHLAVTNRKVESFKVLHGWLRRANHAIDHEGVLNWKDENGDAALHLAVSTNQPEMLKLLLIGTFNINEKNFGGQTVLDIAMGLPQNQNEEVRKILKRQRAAESSSVPTPETLAAYLSSKWATFQELTLRCDVYLDKGLSNEMRNGILVVAVLIATATYQAVLHPPGGISQGDAHQNSSTSNDHTSSSTHAGKFVIPEKYFYPFLTVNSIAFAAAIGVIFTLLPGYFGNILMNLPLAFMFASYVCSGYFISPASPIHSIGIVLTFMYFLIVLLAKFWALNWNRDVIGPRWWSLPYKRHHLKRSVHFCKY